MRLSKFEFCFLKRTLRPLGQNTLQSGQQSLAGWVATNRWNSSVESSNIKLARSRFINFEEI